MQFPFQHNTKHHHTVPAPQPEKPQPNGLRQSVLRCIISPKPKFPKQCDKIPKSHK